MSLLLAVTLVGVAGTSPAGAADLDLGFCTDASIDFFVLEATPEIVSQDIWTGYLDSVEQFVTTLDDVDDVDLHTMLLTLQGAVDAGRLEPDAFGGFDAMTDAEVAAMSSAVSDELAPVMAWVEAQCPTIGAGAYLFANTDCDGWIAPPTVFASAGSEAMTIEVSGTTTKVDADSSTSFNVPAGTQPSDVVVDGDPLVSFTDLSSLSDGDQLLVAPLTCAFPPFVEGVPEARFECNGSGVLTVPLGTLADLTEQERTFDSIDVVVDGTTTTVDYPVDRDLTLDVAGDSTAPTLSFAGVEYPVVVSSPTCVAPTTTKAPSSSDNAPLEPSFTG